MHLKSYALIQRANISLSERQRPHGERQQSHGGVNWGCSNALKHAVLADICPMGKRFYFLTCVLLGYYKIENEPSHQTFSTYAQVSEKLTF